MIARVLIAALLIGGVALAQRPAARVAAPARPAVTDWGKLVRETADGHFVRGNPAAQIRLVEYASFTCPHCAAFAAESAAPLDALISSGEVSLEFRPALRDALDLGAAVAARCGGPTRYFDIAKAIFADQNAIFERAGTYAQAHRGDQRPPLVQLRAVADATGITAIARARGVSDARLASCFNDGRRQQAMALAAQAAWKKITGTPSFFIGDEKLDAGDWAGLQPILQARLAR
ncbi:thioredoxin domain-containing protein [Sphingomonas sp.]|uniref:DsbA family protein n=1 Tax=Sphingomonas sp. TaxID=28214 RepID=UPI001D609640|nr:thioredoxin domain-containing protein [Sphingomonas sp.]MBX9797327.1 DsbA family protein [Sphingomonas sp.]